MRAVVGLVLLIAVALAGVGTLAGPEQLTAALEATGLSRYWPQSAEAPQTAAAASAPETQPAPAPQARYSPFRTVAVSEPAGETATVATGAAPAVSSSLVGRTEIAPPAGPAAVTGAKPGTASESAVSTKKSHYRIACEAGQRLDRAKHRCVAIRHASGSRKPRG